MWKILLVPHDFSTCADAALRLAAELASVHRSALVILHVSDLPPNLAPDARITPPGSAPVRIDDFVTRGAAARLEAAASPLRDRGLRVRTRAIVGSVADEIVAAAEAEEASAIVIGTHGRDGISHLLLGSIAEKIVRRAKVPVVTVRLPAAEAERTEEERMVEDELAG